MVNDPKFYYNGKRFDHIQKMVLDKIRPTKETKVQLTETIIELFRCADNAIKSKSLSYNIEPILVGSIAKDTYLSDPDIDLFLMLPTTVAVEDLRVIGLELGRSILPEGEERYAEHPYISGKFRGFDTDIVPCYKLNNITERMTAVDRTPFHTRFVTEHLKPNQRDQVRLLKQFMKGIGVYGAELEVQGFSGYLCEIMILYYDDFLKLLDNATSWPDELVIDLRFKIKENEKNLVNSTGIISKSKLPKSLALKFKDDPFVFIDPVDSNRNVASAVAREKLLLFKIAAKEYLIEPKLEFFFPKPIQPLSKRELQQQFKTLKDSLLGIQFQAPTVIPDILYGQVRKCQRMLERLLNKSGFGVEYSKYFVSDKILIIFQLKTNQLSDVEIHMGPPEGHWNVDNFLSKWNNSNDTVKKPYLNKGRWYVDIKRKFIKPENLIKNKISDLNLGKQINYEIRKGYRIYKNNELFKEGCEKILTEFFIRKYPWMD